MKNLLKMAISSTEKNIVKTKSTKGMNDFLLEILLDKKVSKNDVIGEISLMRLQDKSEVEIDESNFGSEEIQKEFKKINVTVKNGFESSWCKGQNNASFHFNEKYKNYSFTKENGLYTITKK